MTDSAKTTIMTHCGARYVGWDKVVGVETPNPTLTWFPVPHGMFLHRSEQLLEKAGFRVLQSRYALSKCGGDMFAAMELDSDLVAGVRLAFVLRNSHRQRFSIGGAVGSWAGVCDNLAMDGEVRVDRRHTQFGLERWEEAMSRALSGLNQYREVISRRIACFQEQTMNDGEASEFLFRCAESGILSSRSILKARQEWIDPSWEAYRSQKTQWRAYNAVTTVLRDLAERNPQDHARRTILLGSLLSGNDDSPITLN